MIRKRITDFALEEDEEELEKKRAAADKRKLKEASILNA
jgi:hypothetical protein